MKTETLTPRELAAFERAPIVNPLQSATIAAAKRTGLRVAVSVERGAYHVNVVAYARNPRGWNIGAADVRRLATLDSAAAAIAFLDTL